MQRHFIQELEALKSKIIKMSSCAEEAIARSVQALLERRRDLAQQVIEGDRKIDQAEVDNDEAIIDLLALHQPVAMDLRFLLAALKINNDLERIGDHAVNIAQSAIACAEKPPLKPFIDIPRMGEITKRMLGSAIDGFIHGDAEVCRSVLPNDDAIDDLNKRVIQELMDIIRNDPSTVDQAMDLIRISRNLERVADLATNIAEEVIYMTEAQVVKHGFHLKANNG